MAAALEALSVIDIVIILRNGPLNYKLHLSIYINNQYYSYVLPTIKRKGGSDISFLDYNGKIWINGGVWIILGLHSVHITISNGAEEEGRKFYCRVLGLPEKEKPESLKKRGGFWLKAREIDVRIGTESGFDRFTTKSHLAYQVKDLSYWKNVLQRNHIQFTEGIPIPGFKPIQFRDPFENRVEMIQAI